MGCGDGGPANRAKLSYPKGMAISADGKIYFADGTSIRVVGRDGNIDTLIGGGGNGGDFRPGAARDGASQSSQWQPWSCGGARSLPEAVLRWPTQLAMNPLDDTLHFVDDNLVLKVTADEQVEVVAGRPLHCHRPRSKDKSSATYFNLASQTTLVSPQSISFASSGELFIAESDSGRINRISKVGTDNGLTLFAGKDSKCNCRDPDCDCDGGGDDGDNRLALDTVLGSISSIAVGPDGVLYACDVGNREVRMVRSRIPRPDKNQEYTVPHPETKESYVFNRWGLHTETRHLMTGELLRSFSYSVATSSGNIVGISEGGGARNIKVVRDYAGKVTSIECPLRKALKVRLDRMGMLSRISWGGANGSSVEYSYHRNSELIDSKRDENGNYFTFGYDDNGRLTEAVLPTGEKLGFISDLEMRGAVVNMTRNGRLRGSLLIRPGLVRSTSGEAEEEEGEVVQMRADRSFVSTTKWGERFSIQTSQLGLPALNKEEEGGKVPEGLPLPSSERTELGRDLVNLFEWEFAASSSSGRRRGRRNLLRKILKVNGEEVLEAELNTKRPGSELLKVSGGQTVLNVTREANSDDPTQIDVQPSGLFSSTIIERNVLGQVASWRFGQLSKEFSYDAQGRIRSFGVCGQEKFNYVYSAGNEHPERVTLAGGGVFNLERGPGESLKAVMTPRGHIHGFAVKNSFGMKKYLYQSPWSRQPYEFHYDGDGRLAATLTPGGSSKVVVKRDTSSPSKPRFLVGGGSSVSLRYVGQTGVLRSAERTEEEAKFRMKSDFKHHHGLLKEHKITFHPATPATMKLEDVYIKYQYDGRARLSEIDVAVGGGRSLETPFQYNAVTGELAGVNDLRIRRESLRRKAVEDVAKIFSATYDYDESGRISAKTFKFRNSEVFRLDLAYNRESLLQEKRLKVEGRVEWRQTYSYTPDGHLDSARSSDRSWAYSHDSNGNVVSVSSSGGARGSSVSFGYDAGDRVATLGDSEFLHYDDRGSVVARRSDLKFAYNGLGQLSYAERPGRFAVDLFYDHEGRLSAKRDHRGAVTQYVYAHPRKQSLLTHVHDRSGTTRLYYDDDGHLISVDAPAEGRLYVGTDQLGTPVAVFAAQGELVKEISHSPFGEVVGDTNPALELPLGFAGGIVCQHTRLVHFAGVGEVGGVGGSSSRSYDPTVGQWMTPDVPNPMEKRMTNPQELFAYRFWNNNPVNKRDTWTPSGMSPS